MLTHLNTVPAGPDPAHLSTDAAGRYLLAAYYVDAKVTVHRIGKGGALGKEPLQSLPTADRAHAIVLDPSGRFAFVPHTGPDTIFQFTFDASKGPLSANLGVSGEITGQNCGRAGPFSDGGHRGAPSGHEVRQSPV
jgi:6-phosphogluconolactonase